MCLTSDLRSPLGSFAISERPVLVHTDSVSDEHHPDLEPEDVPLTNKHSGQTSLDKRKEIRSHLKGGKFNMNSNDNNDHGKWKSWFWSKE